MRVRNVTPSSEQDHQGTVRTALVRMMPYMRPHRMLGSVTFQNTSKSEAPSVRAASSCAHQAQS